jgi:hypothetical protein
MQQQQQTLGLTLSLSLLTFLLSRSRLGAGGFRVARRFSDFYPFFQCFIDRLTKQVGTAQSTQFSKTVIEFFGYPASFSNCHLPPPKMH